MKQKQGICKLNWLINLRVQQPHFVLYLGKDAVGVGGENLFSGTTLSTEANEPGHSG